MKTKHLLLSIAVLTTAVLFVIISFNKDITKQNKTNKAIEHSQKKEIKGAVEWLNNRRNNLITGTIDPRDILKAREQVKALRMLKNKSSLNLQWDEMGPDNVGGRTRAILVDRDNPNLIFAGSVSGGLWKSATGGTSWIHVTDNSDFFANLAVVSICQAVNGDIYFGTGEGMYYQSGTGSGGLIGQGMWKSTDHGETFTRLTSTIPTVLNENNVKWAIVNKLDADPVDPNKIYAATNEGLMVTYDGGNTWKNPILNIAGGELTSEASVVKVASDGAVIASVGIKAYISATGDTLRTITGIDDDGNGYAKITTASSHNYFVGQNITIAGISGYNGIHTVTSIVSGNIFVSDFTFTTNETGYISTFVNHPGSPGSPPSLTARRLEFAFAPSDPNYIYCQAAISVNTVVYQSTDKGKTWTVILEGGIYGISDENGILGTQGTFDNVIAVFPDNKEKIICGGQRALWTWAADDMWKQVSSMDVSVLNPMYVHVDFHEIVFHPDYQTVDTLYGNRTLYIGCDGGVFRSTNGTYSFQCLNKNYNTTQFYSVAYSATGTISGGTQDNGSQYIDFKGNTEQYSIHVTSGDGGYSELPVLNPELLFTTVYYGVLYRTDLTNYSVEQLGGWGGSFVTPIVMWESFNDTLSTDSVTFFADTTFAGEDSEDTITIYYPEDAIYATSGIYSRPIQHILTDTLHIGDSVKVQDIYQSALFVGVTGGVRFSRDALELSKTPDWSLINIPSGYVETMALSKDGNYLYVANSSGLLYLCSNVLYSRDGADDIEVQKIATFSGRTITGIAVDPEVANNVVVTLGNYGSYSNYVYYSTNAATTTYTSTSKNFTAKQGNLPQMPVYSAIINWKDSRQVIVGTEYGVYATADITVHDSSVVWTDENSPGMANVATFMIRQQTFENTWKNGVTNHGYIYIGTHGRGIFKSETFKGPAAPVFIAESPVAISKTLEYVNIFPNPVHNTANVSYELAKNADVELKIYNIQGKLVKSLIFSEQQAGKRKYSFNTNDFNAGTYIINVIAGNKKAAARFIVY